MPRKPGTGPNITLRKCTCGFIGNLRRCPRCGVVIQKEIIVVEVKDEES